MSYINKDIPVKNLGFTFEGVIRMMVSSEFEMFTVAQTDHGLSSKFIDGKYISMKPVDKTGRLIEIFDGKEVIATIDIDKEEMMGVTAFAVGSIVIDSIEFFDSQSKRTVISKLKDESGELIIRTESELVAEYIEYWMFQKKPYSYKPDIESDETPEKSLDLIIQELTPDLVKNLSKVIDYCVENHWVADGLIGGVPGSGSVHLTLGDFEGGTDLGNGFFWEHKNYRTRCIRLNPKSGAIELWIGHECVQYFKTLVLRKEGSQGTLSCTFLQIKAAIICDDPLLIPFFLNKPE